MIDQDPVSAAVECVRHFLELCAERRLEEAALLLAPGAELVFPGGTFRSLDAMVTDAAARYRAMRKEPSTWDACLRADGRAVVVCSGVLHGEDLTGKPFTNVRYIDLFVLCDGQIEQQQVWNDLAELGVVQSPTRNLGDSQD